MYFGILTNLESILKKTNSLINKRLNKKRSCRWKIKRKRKTFTEKSSRRFNPHKKKEAIEKTHSMEKDYENLIYLQWEN